MILKEEMLDLVSEKQIMENYWDECLVDNKAIYKNPMRIDNKGTCFFKWYGDKYMFVDRARGIEANFDCFDYVMWLYSCNFYEAMIRINDDMILSSVKRISKSKESRRKVTSNKNKRKKKRVKFKTVLRSWNKHDVEYWGQYGISIKNVAKIIRPIQSYKSNSNSFSFTLKYTYSPDDPCYVFKWPNSNNIKLYQPYSKYSKWRSNTTANNIFGYSFLDHFGEDLYIVSGGKDLLCMWEMGFNNVVAPLSESTKIPEKYMNDLKSRFTNIYYLYDNDETGIKMSTKFAIQDEVFNLILPQDTIHNYKDIAEYCKGIGLNKTKNIINNVRRESISKRESREKIKS